MAINLQKGQRINLEKSNGSKLQYICVGLNWGAIEKKGFFGKTTKVAVDLDASCALFDSNKKLVDIIYFGNLRSRESAVIHSGDDRTGDTDGDDGLDNEVITIDFGHLNKNVVQVAFVLNSYQGQDFASIPFASIRIYEGTPTRVNEIFAKFDIAHDLTFSGYVSMVMGIFYLKNGDWKFNAIGEPTKDRKLEETIRTVEQKYL